MIRNVIYIKLNSNYYRGDDLLKEIRLCDETEPKKVLDLCANYSFGIEIQGFYNSNLIGTDETQKLIDKYKEVLATHANSNMPIEDWIITF